MKWYDMRATLERYPQATFFFVIGMRGNGKTYSTLRYAREEALKLDYMRRTLTEIEMCATEKGNPFKSLNNDFSWNVHFDKAKKNYYIYDSDELCGYADALSTFDNVRGMDMTDIDMIYFDEFIRPPSKDRIKNEADIFFNAYETISRNREIRGLQPVKCVLTANSMSLDSEILSELGFVPEIERMRRHGQKLLYVPERGVVIELTDSPEVAQEKEKTALYKLTKGTRFSEHALKAEFVYDDFYGISEIKNLLEWTPLCAIEDIFVYKHKSKNLYYASRVRGSCMEFEDRNAVQFFRHYGILLREEFFSGNLTFSDFQIKKRLTKYLKI